MKYLPAPGDDGAAGRAARYEVRRHSAVVDGGSWAEATPVEAPVPGVAGHAEVLTVEGLASGTTYWFAVRAVDERGNRGPVSNAASVATVDVADPGRVRDLAAVGGARSLALEWTAGGDDGDVGQAARVEVRYAPTPWPGWAAAESAMAPSAPAGEPVRYTLRGLTAERRYAVAVAAVDEDGNQAAPSNVADAWTDAVPPSAVGGLAVEPDGPGALRLSWVEPADDGVDVGSGAVARYEVVVAGAVFGAGDFGGQKRDPGPAPDGPGKPLTWRVDGLADDRPYWVAVRAIDDRGSAGAVVQVVAARTLDVAAPARVVSLVATGPRAGGDPLAVASAEASAELSEAWPAAAAFDGDGGSSWAALAEGEPTLTAHLPRAARLGGVRLYAGAWADRFPTGFVVEGQVGGAWAELAVVRQVAPEPDTWVALDFEAATVTAARIRVTRAPAGEAVVLGEVEWLSADDPADTVVLSWVAPGDDGDQGTATRYEVRRSDAPLDAAGFDDATPVAALAPAEAGTPQSLRVEGLPEATKSWFALVAVDEAGNRGAVSNVAHATTAGVPPARVLDLVAEAQGTDVVLSWTAPEDADRYDLRMRVGDLSAATWAEGVVVETGAPGGREQVRVSGLLPATVYGFALRATDGLGHTGHLSVTATVLTAPAPDVVGPAAIDDLVARANGAGALVVPVDAAASGAQAELPAAAAVDGDPSTAWASPARASAGEEVLDLTLAEPTTVSAVLLRPHADFVDLFPAGLRLEGTVDGRAWFPLVEAEGHAPHAGRWSRFEFDPTAVSRVRVAVARVHRAPAWLAVVGEVALEEAAAPGTVTLSFRAPGDDGDVGTAARYLLARSDEALDAGGWDAAEVVELALVPAGAGAPQAVTRSGLAPGEHHFAVRAEDEAGNLGPVGASARVVIPAP